MKSKKIDLTGERFGRLVVIGLTECAKDGEAQYLCKCDCGKTKSIRKHSLLRGYTKSCGCLRMEGLNVTKALEFNKNNNFKENTYLSALTKQTQSNNTSGHVGVCYHTQIKKWRAYIKLRGNQIHLGLYEDISDAIKARKKAEGKYFNPILEKYRELEEANDDEEDR